MTEDTITDILETYLNHLDGNAPEPDVSEYTRDDQDTLRGYFRLLRDLYGTLSDRSDTGHDPVFIALGFDRAGHDITIDGKRVSSVRKRAGLDYAAVLLRMNNAGANWTMQQLMRLELSTASPVPQHDATALIAALRVSLSDIESTGGPSGAVASFLQSPLFEAEILDWAGHRRVDLATTRRQITNELLAANFRGGEHADQDDLLELLRAILSKRDTHGDNR
jgi:transcriptional regulator with XRE-family HTH domain